MPECVSIYCTHLSIITPLRHTAIPNERRRMRHTIIMIITIKFNGKEMYIPLILSMFVVVVVVFSIYKINAIPSSASAQTHWILNGLNFDGFSAYS